MTSLQNWVVVGCSRGIGLQLMKQLSQNTEKVGTLIGVCRAKSDALQEVLRESRVPGGAHIIEDVDCAKMEEVGQLGEKIEENLSAGVSKLKQKFSREINSNPVTIHNYVHNAAIFHSRGSILSNFGNEDFGKTVLEEFQVNALAPVLAVKSCLERNLFANGSKIAFITSRMGSIASNGSSGYNYGTIAFFIKNSQ